MVRMKDNYTTIALAMLTIIIIAMMILPVPAFVLDLGLAISFAIAILMLTLTIFVDRPLDFSSFPSLLLFSLLLRLALNVSSTKLIISNGHEGPDAAGHVIEGFANFIMSGDVVIGVIIFIILMIINFTVITKGAGRMAEVGARFALDGMPGRQLAIDADMASGAINHSQAKERRAQELAETNFFGSLDGASKFVKGDAVAGLLITALNVIVGTAVGILSHEMKIVDAISIYTFLTIGDGLVTQIPAVIISVSAAILLSRGGEKGSIDKHLKSQIVRYPTALIGVAGMLFLFSLIPGLPFIPFLISSFMIAGLSLLKSKPDNDKDALISSSIETSKKIGDVLDFDEIHIDICPSLVPQILKSEDGLDSKISNIRNHITSKYGLIIPEIRITDDYSAPKGGYRIFIQGVETASGNLEPEMLLVISQSNIQALTGIEVSEPVYGTPAKWIALSDREKAIMNGMTVVSCAEVISTHLLETIKSHLAELMSLRGLRKLLDEFCHLSDIERSRKNRELLDDIIPHKVPLELLHAILKLLLSERVSIRNLPLILEALSEIKSSLSLDASFAHVRRKLSQQISYENRGPSGQMSVVQLDPAWERIFQNNQVELPNGTDEVILPPNYMDNLIKQLSDCLSTDYDGNIPVLLTLSHRRKYLLQIIKSKGLNNSVISYDELIPGLKPILCGTVIP